MGFKLGILFDKDRLPNGNHNAKEVRQIDRKALIRDIKSIKVRPHNFDKDLESK